MKPLHRALALDRPRPGANQTGAGSPTTQQGARETSSIPHDDWLREAGPDLVGWEPGDTRSEAGALEFAWRVHDGAAGAIERVGAKAGFAATVEAAAAAALLAFAGSGPAVTSPAAVLLAAGAALLGAALVLAGAVVLPVLRSRRATRLDANFLYFGALRHSSPRCLAVRMYREDAVRLVCEQAVTLAGLAYRKHRLLQLSLLAALTAGVLCAAAVSAGGA